LLASLITEAAPLHHRGQESNDREEEVWPLRVIQEHVEQGYCIGGDKYPARMLTAEHKRCRTCAKQCKRYRVKRSTVRLVLPNKVRAAYRYSTDYHGKRHVCTPVAMLPPASPLQGGMPAPNLHDTTINSCVGLYVFIILCKPNTAAHRRRRDTGDNHITIMDMFSHTNFHVQSGVLRCSTCTLYESARV
jgi:hypothetical protein